MMILVWLLGGLFLAFSFGRNTVGNVFGTAIGTGALSQHFCAVLMGVFILMGACYGGQGIQSTLTPFLSFTSAMHVFIFSLVLAGLICFLTAKGLPVSLAQLGMGGLIGWNWGSSVSVPSPPIFPIVVAWFVSPLVAGFFSFMLFKTVRWFLKKKPIPLLYRDLFVRLNLIWIGCVIAFTLGQNNLSVLTVPFFSVFPEAHVLILSGMGLAIFGGTWTASRKVIRTWTKGLFPLSSLEAMLTGLSTALVMFLFSLNLPFTAAVPISSAAALIGGIVGISLAKGGQGLQMKVLGYVVASWVWSPCVSGLLCFVISAILNKGEGF